MPILLDPPSTRLWICSKVGHNHSNRESITIEVPKGMVVPEEVDQSNWNKRRYVFGGSRRVFAGIQETRAGPETFDISSVEDEEADKQMITVTRTDGGQGSPGWNFNLTFSGEISGEALSLLDDDADETMASSDWKEQYIELLYFKIKGRCSVCRSKTTNESIEELHVRLCKACTVTGVMTTTNVKKMFNLNKKDLENVPSIRQGGGKVYLKRHVLRIAVEKCGGKEKFAAKEMAKRAKKNKADFKKHTQMHHLSLVEKWFTGVGVTLTLNEMVVNKIDAASKLDTFIKGDRPGQTPWCSGLAELLNACKSEGSTLLRQETVRQLYAKDGKIVSEVSSQHRKGQYATWHYNGGGIELGDGSTTGLLKDDGAICQDQAKHFPFVQKYLLDGEDVLNPESSDGSNFTDGTFFAHWKAKVEERSAKIDELKTLVEGKAAEFKMPGYRSPFLQSAAFKAVYTLTVFPENFEQMLAAILAECDGVIKQNAIDIDRREKSTLAATEKVKEREVQHGKLHEELLSAVIAELAPEGYKITDEGLRLFDAGLSWFEGKERAGDFYLKQYKFKNASLEFFFSHSISLPLKKQIQTQSNDQERQVAWARRQDPTYKRTPITVPQSKIEELKDDFIKTVVASKEYAAAQAKKGSQQRIPKLMNDADIQTALGGGDPFHLFRTAFSLYCEASRAPVMVQDSNNINNQWRRIESESLPWKCTHNISDGLAKDAHEARCLCGDGGPALFKACVLDWAARRDALFGWMETKKTTLSELMKKGQSVRKEVCKYLAKPLIMCNPAVMAKQILTDLAPRPEEEGADGQAGSAADCMAFLAVKIDEDAKNFQTRVQALKKVRVPVVGDEARVDIGSLVDATVEDKNDAASKYITEQMEATYGAEVNSQHGYQPSAYQIQTKRIETFDIQIHTNSRQINALRAKLGSWFPLKELVGVLNGHMEAKEFQKLVSANAEQFKVRAGRLQEADEMAAKIFGKDEVFWASKQRSVSNARDRFMNSGSAAGKATLLATLKAAKSKLNEETAKSSVEADRKERLNDELKLCPKWIELQDPVKLHVRNECAEYQAVRNVIALSNTSLPFQVKQLVSPLSLHVGLHCY